MKIGALLSVIFIFCTIQFSFCQANFHLIKKSLSECALNWSNSLYFKDSETFEFTLENTYSFSLKEIKIKLLDQNTTELSKENLNNHILQLYYSSIEVLTSLQDVSEPETGFTYNAYLVRDNNEIICKNIHFVVKICELNYLISYFGHVENADQSNFDKLECVSNLFEKYKCS